MAAPTVQVSATGEKRRERRFQDLFFFKRRPRRNIPSEWERPTSDDDYQNLIDSESFVSIKVWKEKQGDDLSAHRIITQDLADLEEHLLPTYFMLNQKAKHYQNLYYSYQWIFVWGAFLTTLFGTLAAFASNSSATGTEDVVARGLSIATAVIGAATAYFTALSNRGRPQERWAKTRILTEEVRNQYFKYLAHLPPYDKPDRVQKLRENVVEVRVKEQENQGGAA